MTINPKFAIMLLLVLITNAVFAIDVKIKLKKEDKIIDAVLLSITPELVQIDPNGPVSLLTLKSEVIESVTIIKTGEILNFPISNEEIQSKLLEKVRKDNQRRQFAKKKNIGFKVGINFSTLSGFGNEYGDKFADELNNESGFYGFESNNVSRKPLSFGVVFLKEINNSFSMQGEMNFSFRGIAVKTNGYYEGYSVHNTTIFKINYFEIPLLAKYSFSPKKNFNFYAGPSIAILTSSKLYLKVEIEGESDDDEMVLDVYKSIDFDLNFGCDVYIIQEIFFDFRYTMGLSNILENTNGNDEWKNSVFNFSLGFLF